MPAEVVAKARYKCVNLASVTTRIPKLETNLELIVDALQAVDGGIQAPDLVAPDV